MAPEGMLAGFGNKRGIKGDDPLAGGTKDLVNQLPIERNKAKRLRKLPRIGLFRVGTIATQITKGDFATQRENGHE